MQFPELKISEIQDSINGITWFPGTGSRIKICVKLKSITYYSLKIPEEFIFRNFQLILVMSTF